MKSLMKRRIVLGLLPLAAVLGGLLGGCESAPAPSADALWVPTARPTFTTIGRTTSYALTHTSAHDLLVLEDPILDESGEKQTGRLTWIVALPPTTAFDTPVEVGGKEFPAWLVEQLEGEQSHSAPAYGRVIVHSRDAENLSATLNLHTFRDELTAGVTMRPTVDLDRKISFRFYQPQTPQYQEMKKRSGSDSVRKRKKK